MSIGTKIEDLIFEKQITQKQLATALNVAPSTINGYIKKGREPDIEMLRKLAAYFDVTIDYLVDYNKEVESSDGKLLNTRENEMISYYRRLDNEQQDLLIEQAKFFLSRNAKKIEKSLNTTSKTGTEKNR